MLEPDLTDLNDDCSDCSDCLAPRILASNMQVPTNFKQITLHERPTAAIEPTTFKTVQVAGSDVISKLKEDQVIVRVDYVSLDPAMRGWLSTARSYLPPVQIGEVMRSAGLGEVVKVGSAVTKVKIGDFIQAGTGQSTLLQSQSRRGSFLRSDAYCAQVGPSMP